MRCGDATLHTLGGFHGNFVDAPLWAPSWVMTPLSFVIPASGPCDPIAMHAMLARTARLFCDAVGKGDPIPIEDLLKASADPSGFGERYGGGTLRPPPPSSLCPSLSQSFALTLTVTSGEPEGSTGLRRMLELRGGALSPPGQAQPCLSPLSSSCPSRHPHLNLNLRASLADLNSHPHT